MSRVILCKIGPRLGELRKLLDLNTSSPLVLTKQDVDDDNGSTKFSLASR